MKNIVKPSLILIFCLGLGSLGVFFLPITEIQYQIVDENQSNGSASTIVSAKGYARAYGNQYGTEAIPCDLPKLNLPSTSYPRSYGWWQWMGKVQGIVLVALGATYLRHRKISGVKLFLLIAALIAIPLVVALLFPENRPMCSPNVLYRITSFRPYFPTILLLISGILLGFSANRSIKNREILNSRRLKANTL